MYSLIPQGYILRLKTKLVPDFGLLSYKIAAKLDHSAMNR